jgi:hypothetical protein
MEPITQASSALTPLAQYGGTGVAIAALVVLVVIAWRHSQDMRAQAKEAAEAMRAMAADHAEAMQVHTAAMGETIDRNTAAMTKSAEATAALSASLPHVCRFSK